MQEGIMQIGHAVLKEGTMLENLVQELPSFRKNKQLYVLKFNFLTKEETLKVDTKEEMNEKTAEKYLFIGSAAGAASPQWYATSTTFMYYLTETFPNLMNIDLGEELNQKIKSIKENFYVDLGSALKSNKNRFVLDFKKCSIREESPRTIFMTIQAEEKEKLQRGEIEEKELEKSIKEKLKKTYSKEFEAYIKNELQINPKEIGLYTLLIDGQPLSDFKEYREAVLREKQKESTEGDKKAGKKENKKTKKDKEKPEAKYCSLCGGTEKVTDKIKTEIKFYTTNQVIFASGLDVKQYGKNMLLCQDCLNKILVGEKYILNHLDTKLSGFNVYIVPHFILGEPMEKEQLDECCGKIVKSFNTLTSYESIEQLKEEIENTLALEEREKESYYLLNFIFYKKLQKATKVQRLVKDVNPSIFEEIGKALFKTNRLARRLFGEAYDRYVKLSRAYYLTPVRLKKGEPMQYKNLLNIYDGILSKSPLKKSNIITNILGTIKIQHFGEEGYNVTKGTIHNTMMDGNMFIKFLEYHGCIKEGEAMDYTKLAVEDTIKTYIEEMRYNEQQSALFLMGYLIGEIGNAQRKRSKEGKKPILNKLNFGGIDKGKLIRLTGEIFNKLKQEKILKYNEILFAESKRLLDKNLNQWNMNKQENLFYILSGYGYVSTKFIFNKKNGGEEHEE